MAAAIKFGWAEMGAPGSYYCSQRREACIANSSTTPPTDGVTAPFQYETSDSWTGISCASTCSITIPVKPSVGGRIVYYQAEYLNSNGVVVATDNPALAVVP